jgi:hypothetical protein
MEEQRPTPNRFKGEWLGRITAAEQIPHARAALGIALFGSARII